MLSCLDRPVTNAADCGNRLDWARPQVDEGACGDHSGSTEAASARDDDLLAAGKSRHDSSDDRARSVWVRWNVDIWDRQSNQVDPLRSHDGRQGIGMEASVAKTDRSRFTSIVTSRS